MTGWKRDVKNEEATYIILSTRLLITRGILFAHAHILWSSLAFTLGFSLRRVGHGGALRRVRCAHCGESFNWSCEWVKRQVTEIMERCMGEDGSTKLVVGEVKLNEESVERALAC